VAAAYYADSHDQSSFDGALILAAGRHAALRQTRKRHSNPAREWSGRAGRAAQAEPRKPSHASRATQAELRRPVSAARADSAAKADSADA